MNKTVALRFVLGAVFVLYPGLIYFGLRSFEPRFIAISLVALGALRLLFGHLNQQLLIFSLLSLVLVAAVTLATGSENGLLVYPVLMNIALFGCFAYSLVQPPSMIERFARIREPNLPPDAVRYTRKVTLVWCLFFIINGTIATITTIASITLLFEQKWWALYNGLIAYILMGILVCGEYLVRRNRMNHANG